LLKALRYGTRKPRVTRSTIELQLLSSEGLNNHDNRGIIEDVSWATLQRGDLHTVPTDSTPGGELTKRKQNATEEYRRINKRRLEAEMGRACSTNGGE
jgi:hypothetical protein